MLVIGSIIHAQGAGVRNPSEKLNDYVKRRAAELQPQIEVCCEKNGDIFTDDKTRRYICSELDEIGGQPVITFDITERTEKWIKEKFSKMPVHYCRKSIIQQQVDARVRQDQMLKAVQTLRESVRYGYAQCLSFKIGTEKYEEMAILYTRLMASKDWKKLCERADKIVEVAVESIVAQITQIHLLNVNAYDKILISKRIAYAKFAESHPQTVQTVRAIQRAKAAEARAAQAEWEASVAAAKSAAAAQHAAEAESRAEDAERRAAESAHQARRAEERLMFGVP